MRTCIHESTSQILTVGSLTGRTFEATTMTSTTSRGRIAQKHLIPPYKVLAENSYMYKTNMKETPEKIFDKYTDTGKKRHLLFSVIGL